MRRRSYQATPSILRNKMAAVKVELAQMRHGASRGADQSEFLIQGQGTSELVMSQEAQQGSSTMATESREAGASAPSTSQRRSPPPTVGFNGPGSRANSGDSWPGEEEERDQGADRVSLSPTTASQWRGEDVTHSIALQLQRARHLLNVMTADPESTKYKMQRKKVTEMLDRAERHLIYDQVSTSYEELLVGEMIQAEIDCSTKDDELDLAERKKKKVEGDKKDLLATLPRGLGQRFSGSAADWPAFRHYFEEINESVSPPLAVAHMTALIGCPKLKKRMKIYRSGDEVLKDFDKDYGFSFLNCATIINEINNLKRATTKSEEIDLIIKYRHAKRALDMNADHERLLNLSTLIRWADQLLPTTCESLMRVIQEFKFGEQGSAVEEYFRHLEQVYERSSILLRSRSARRAPHMTNQPKPGGKSVDWVESDQRTYASEDAGGDKAEGDSDEDGDEISSHERRSDGENGSGEDRSEISSHESNSDGEGDSDGDGDKISSHERSDGESGSGEDRSEISSHESDSDGEGDSDEDRAPSKTKETELTGLRAWECPRCKILNSASWIKCNGTSQGEEEEDVCLLARPRYEKYRVTQIKSKKTIRDGDWNCFYCGNNNFQFRIECNKCKLSKNDAQSDKFRMLEGDETRDRPGNVSTDNSDE